MKNLLQILLPIFFMGCAQGNCRSQISANPTTPPEAVMKGTSNPSDRIRIFKYDGSLQCGGGKTVNVEDMAKELKGIKIYSSGNKPDGLMHMQMCGTPTGRANIYEIDINDLPAAKKAGFKEWTWE